MHSTASSSGRKKSDVSGTPALPAGRFPSSAIVRFAWFGLKTPRYAPSAEPDGRRYSNGTPSHEPPARVEGFFLGAGGGLRCGVGGGGAGGGPTPAVSARDPPADRHTPTLPGVTGGVAKNWLTVSGGVGTTPALKFPDAMLISL